MNIYLPYNFLFLNINTNKFGSINSTKLQTKHLSILSKILSKEQIKILESMVNLPRTYIEFHRKNNSFELIPKLYFGFSTPLHVNKEDAEKEMYFISKYCPNGEIRSRYLFLTLFESEQKKNHLIYDEEWVTQLKKDIFKTVELLLEPINQSLKSKS